MKKLAASLLVVIGVGCSGYIAQKTLIPFAISCFALDHDGSELALSLFPDWWRRRHRLHTPCFGLCPEMEIWSW
jgi:hypothetical protein